MQAKFRNSRWQLKNQKCLLLEKYTDNCKISTSELNAFRVQELNWAILDIFDY